MNLPNNTIEPIDDAVAVYEQLWETDPEGALDAAIGQFGDCELELRRHAEIRQRVQAVCSPLRQAATSIYTPPHIEGYEELTEIGRGGMGVVYRAIQTRTHRPVAIKVIRPERLESFSAREQEEAIARFHLEAMAAADHEHIVRVYYAGETSGSSYLVMEFVPGVTLNELVMTEACSLSEIVRYVEQAARALDYAHSQGVLHRDVKPANILIDRERGVARVADFGLAKLEHGPEIDGAGISPAIVGTLPFMAPEQLHDSEKATTASDIYGLGASLYKAITGRAPFLGESREIIDAIKNSEPPPPRNFNASLPGKLEAICLKCLRKNPQDRYRTAAELAADLARLQSLKGGGAAIFFTHMSWLLIGFALFSGLVHCGVYWLLAQSANETIIWLMMFATHPLLFAIFWFTKTPIRKDSQSARRELWSIWIGHFLLSAVAAFAIRWRTTSAVEAVESAYIVLAVATGMALFCMSANFWRFHLALAIGWFAIAIAMVLAPVFAPLLFAGGSAICSIIIGMYELHLSREQLLDIPLAIHPQFQNHSAAPSLLSRPRVGSSSTCETAK